MPLMTPLDHNRYEAKQDTATKIGAQLAAIDNVNAGNGGSNYSVLVAEKKAAFLTLKAAKTHGDYKSAMSEVNANNQKLKAIEERVKHERQKLLLIENLHVLAKHSPDFDKDAYDKLLTKAENLDSTKAADEFKEDHDAIEKEINELFDNAATTDPECKALIAINKQLMEVRNLKDKTIEPNRHEALEQIEKLITEVQKRKNIAHPGVIQEEIGKLIKNVTDQKDNIIDNEVNQIMCDKILRDSKTGILSKVVNSLDEKIKNIDGHIKGMPANHKRTTELNEAKSQLTDLKNLLANFNKIRSQLQTPAATDAFDSIAEKLKELTEDIINNKDLTTAEVKQKIEQFKLGAAQELQQLALVDTDRTSAALIAGGLAFVIAGVFTFGLAWVAGGLAAAVATTATVFSVAGATAIGTTGAYLAYGITRDELNTWRNERYLDQQVNKIENKLVDQHRAQKGETTPMLENIYRMGKNAASAAGNVVMADANKAVIKPR